MPVTGRVVARLRAKREALKHHENNAERRDPRPDVPDKEDEADRHTPDTLTE